VRCTIPFYHYHCKVCDHHTEVIRPFKDYEIPPSGDELPEEIREACIVAGEKKGDLHDWERLLNTPLRTLAWPSTTGPGKGNWGRN
jgi:hypothetical protein